MIDFILGLCLSILLLCLVVFAVLMMGAFIGMIVFDDPGYLFKPLKKWIDNAQKTDED